MAEKLKQVEKFRLSKQHKQVARALGQLGRIRKVLQQKTIQQQLQLRHTQSQAQQVDQQFQQMLRQGQELPFKELDGQDLQLNY